MQLEVDPALRAAVLAWRPKRAAVLVCKTTYRLEPETCPLHDDPESPNEFDTYWDDDTSRSLASATDLVPFKGNAEVVLVGCAFAPPGQRVRSRTVRLTVGDVDKAFDASCERSWTPEGELREGQPFDKMPLRYERAAGGPDTWNPVGIPHAATPNARGLIPIPNLQPAGLHVTTRETFIAPVGFGPIAPTWPSRLERIAQEARGWDPGAWLEADWPAGVDPAFFNTAPWDQHLERIRPDEAIILEGLSPEIDRLVTRLPGVRPRARVRGATGEELLELVADTLVIDTDRHLVTVTWRGQTSLAAGVTIVVELETGAARTTPPPLGFDHPGNGTAPAPAPAPAPAIAPMFASPAAENAVGRSAPVDSGAPAAWLAPALAPAVAADPATEDVEAELDPDEQTPDPAPSDAPIGVAAPLGSLSVVPAVPASSPGSPAMPLDASRPPAPASRAPAPPRPPQRGDGAASKAPSRPGEDAPAPFAPRSAETNAKVGAATAPLNTGLPGGAPHVPPPPPSSMGHAGPVGTPAMPPFPVAAASAPPPLPSQPKPAAMPSAMLPVAPRPSTTSQPPPGALPGKRPPMPTPPLDAGPPASPSALPPPPKPRASIAPSPPPAFTQSPREEGRGANPRAAEVPAAPPAGESVMLLDAVPTAAARARRGWPDLVRSAELRASLAGDDLDADAASDARRLLAVLARADLVDLRGLDAVVAAATDPFGAFEPPHVVVAGEIELLHDEVEALRALLAVVSPFVAADRKLKEVVDGAAEAARSPGFERASGAAERLSAAVLAAFAETRRGLPPRYAEAQIDRMVHEGRGYSKRTLLGRTWVRTLMVLDRALEPVVLYLPERFAVMLPLTKRFRARVLAEVGWPQEEGPNVGSRALFGVALGRLR